MERLLDPGARSPSREPIDPVRAAGFGVTPTNVRGLRRRSGTGCPGNSKGQPANETLPRWISPQESVAMPGGEMNWPGRVSVEGMRPSRAGSLLSRAGQWPVGH